MAATQTATTAADAELAAREAENAAHAVLVAETVSPELAALLADTTLIGYAEFGKMIDRMPQSLRSAMMRRNAHIRDEGKPRATDLPTPDHTKYAWPRTEPQWKAGKARAWAMRTGKLQEDGVTPIPYRGSDKKRKEYREAHGLPLGGRTAAAAYQRTTPHRRPGLDPLSSHQAGR